VQQQTVDRQDQQELDVARVAKAVEREAIRAN